MIIKKAPKDMNAVEFVDYLINGGVLTSIPDDDSFIKLAIIKDALNKPAPNPFTPDQLAWMREEQRSSMKYAAKDSDGIVSLYTEKPIKFLDSVDEYGYDRPCWDMTEEEYENGGGSEDVTHVTFLFNLLLWEDEEPLCFADYAPLE